MSTTDTTTAPVDETVQTPVAAKPEQSTPTTTAAAVKPPQRGGWSYKAGAIGSAWTGLLALGIGTGGAHVLLIIAGLLLLSVAITALTVGGGK